MISGNSDERMAFVLETEANLEGSKQMRAEMAGIGSDAEALGGRLASFSGKSKAAFDAMTASEKQAFLGFIGVNEGATVANKALNQSAIAATRTSDSMTPISSKARTAANAMSSLSFAAAGLTAGGQSSVIAMGSLTSSLAHLSSSAALAAGASGIGALVVVAATIIPLLSRMANESERVAGGFGKAFGGTGDEGAERFLQLARARRAAAQTAVENAPSALSPRQSDLEERKNRQAALAEAVKDEQTAIDAVFAARRSKRQKEREDAKRDAEQRVQDEVRARELGEQMRGRTLMLGQERMAPELAAITGIQMEQAARDAAIRKFHISDDEKNARIIESARLAEAQVTKIYNDEAEKRMDKADEEARRHEEIDRRRARKRFDIAKQNIDAIVRAEGSLGQTLKRLALEPIIGELEGIAAREAVKAIASFPDFSAMAIHGAAAVAATAAAREVAGWAGTGTKGGGGAGGAGSGSGPGSFEPRGSTEGRGSLVVNLYSVNPYGAEQIQQLKWDLERAEVLNRQGVQINPTNQLRAA